ncbi:Ger(x)C family spore germination protein [Paenibacillus lautus]|uniref:Ger(x)C family spore germination protein n=1 Tax=Paenibacillus lautus TaxID=1401 RepID=UPI002DBCAFAB|nr:Ger(x)C family spore germination protein [Paenibacillus lautus]MEC0206951.1 Ger(x)C family spore germination protein [Paenibacillus lautus]
MRRQQRAVFVTGLAFLMVVGLCGCWSSVELNNRAFATAMLVDLGENGDTVLSISFPLATRMVPGQTGGTGENKGQPFTYVTKRAENISQAFRLIQLDTSRVISFGQTRIIIIGKRLAEQGIDNVIEFVNRQPAFHLSANLFITPGKVEEIQKTPMVFERLTSTILKKYVAQHITLDTTVKDFILGLYEGGDILVPLLSFTLQPEVEVEKPEKNRWMGSGGAAIFSNGRMSKIKLSKEELQGALWISSQLKNYIASVYSPTDGKEVSCVLEGISSKINPSVKNGKVSFTIKSKATGYILTSLSDLDLKDEKNIRKIEQILDQDLEKRFDAVLSKTRKASSDAFLMNQHLKWRHPKIWESKKREWKSYYATELPINISVDISITRSGGVYRSVNNLETHR